MVLYGYGWTRESVCCVRALPSSGLTEWRKLSCVLILVSFWLDLSHREDAEGRFLVCVSQAGMRLPV